MDDERAMLVAAYWREHRLSSGSRAERLEVERDGWAQGAVNDVVSEMPEDALGLFDDLLATSDADPVFVGAGPLEDLLVEHGAVVQEAVLDRCHRLDTWRLAVAGVWLDERERSQVASLAPYLPKVR